MSKETERITNFYKNLEVRGYDLRYHEIIYGVENTPTFLTQIRTDEKFFEVAFPSIMRHVLSGGDFSELFTDKELTTRVLTLYVSILHRMGFRLYDPVSGSFDLLTRKNGFAEVLPDEIFRNKGAMDLFGPILEQIMRSLVLLGFGHYTIFLHNAIHRLYLENPAYGLTKSWLTNRFACISADLIYLSEQRQKEGSTSVPFSEWVQSWRSTEFKALLMSPEGDVLTQEALKYTPPGGAMNIIKFCSHGVYMRTIGGGNSSKMFNCIIEVQNPGSDYKCNAKYACR